ncbi:hypothetical protein [Streptomyces sp. NPDC000851]
MAIAGLEFPVNIPWTRVCVSGDMLDPGIGPPGTTPPLWQSSMALFCYEPPDEYQVHPGRKILYYKLTCTITNYQPQTDQILGQIDWNSLNYTEAQDLGRKLRTSLPCNGAIVQVTVTPPDGDKNLGEYPYFMEVQPRQRLLYEQATDTSERVSRSLEDVQIRKDGGSSDSLEVLDVDQGGGLNVEAFGVGAGGQRAGQWGTKSIGKTDSSNVTTTDSSRESRETLAFTTQLTQMYTMLQSYHLGTNRVFFYLVPRPHALEEPSGFINGPRRLDGIQDFFLVVNQDEDAPLPCLEARLDTGHLTRKDILDYDRSRPSQSLTVELSVPAPAETDTRATRNPVGESPFYNCYDLAQSTSQVLSAPSSYIIEGVTETSDNVAIRGSSTLEISPDRRQVTLTASATSYACYRNSAGDAANHAALGPLDFAGIDIWPETWTIEPARVRRTVQVQFRSETPTRKVGEEQVLALTTRVLRCCPDRRSVLPKIMELVSLERPTAMPTTAATPVVQDVLLEAETAGDTAGQAVEGTPGGGMTARQANELTTQVMSEIERLATGAQDPDGAPARDGALLVASLARATLADPRRQGILNRPAASTGLSEEQIARLAEALNRLPETLSRYDVLATPDAVLETSLDLSPEIIARLRLTCVGVPTADDAGPYCDGGLAADAG